MLRSLVRSYTEWGWRCIRYVHIMIEICRLATRSKPAQIGSRAKSSAIEVIWQLLYIAIASHLYPLQVISLEMCGAILSNPVVHGEANRIYKGSPVSIKSFVRGPTLWILFDVANSESFGILA